jgi:hypothetical protein
MRHPSSHRVRSERVMIPTTSPSSAELSTRTSIPAILATRQDVPKNAVSSSQIAIP